MQDVTVAERMTQERRRERTRDLLLDAAEEVFAQKGFEGASLEEIADTAGYTRGAIYKHFASKADLFLTLNKRFNERFLDGFAGAVEPGTPLEEIDLVSIAKQWHAMQYSDPKQFALGLEFQLYVLRHPEERARVAALRKELAELIAAFIEQEANQFGETLKMSPMTVARLVLATSDGLQLAGFLDDEDEEDLYVPFLELLLAIWERPGASPAPLRTKATPRKTRTPAPRRS